VQATGCFGLLSPFLDLTDRGVSSNPTACASSDVVFGSDAKPQCFDDSRDSKNDSIWVARREMQRRRRHAPSCMGGLRRG